VTDVRNTTVAVDIVAIPIKTGAASVVPATLRKSRRMGTLFMGSQTGKAKTKAGAPGKH
jgi:hypothetical protein